MKEQQKFTRYWTQAQPIVSAYVSSMVPDFQQAEDILQDVAVVLMKKFGYYDEKQSFIAWALGVARLEVLSKKRAYARSFISFHNDILEKVEHAYAEMAPELETRKRALTLCIKEISDEPGEILKLRYLDGLKPAGIAKKVGIAVNAVRTMLHRIRNKLRACIERRLRTSGEDL